QLPDRPGQRHHVDLAGRVDAERRDLADLARRFERRAPVPVLADAAGAPAEAADPAEAVLAVEVDAVERRQRGAAGDHAAGARAALLVRVVGERRGEPGAIAALRAVAVPALGDAPAEVPAVELAGGDQEHRPPQVL